MSARKQASHQDMNGLKVTNIGTPTAGSTDSARIVDVETAATSAKSRANHTGTQLAATISDFDTQVRTSRLDQLATPTGSIGAGNQKIINLLDPTSASDASTKNYVDSQLAGLSSGQTLKGTVRAAVTSNVNIASPGTTLDGLTAVAGDVFLLTAETTGSTDGPYVWNGAAVPMTRATNWDVAGEAVIGSYWIVREGTNADKFALMTNDTFTFGTTTPTFTFIGVAPVLAVPVELDLGNGAATSFVVNHNFNTRALNVVIYRNSSPWDEIDVYIEHTDLNNITIKPDVAFATNEFHAIVSKM